MRPRRRRPGERARASTSPGQYPPEAERPGHKYSSELFADAAVEFLQKRRDENPFAMWVAFTTPHDPRTVPPGFEQMYDPAKVPPPANFLPIHPFDHGELDVRDEQLLPSPRTRETISRETAAYYAMISHMDGQIGRIIRSLEETGQLDNTVVVFTTDNGLALGSHGLLGKQNLYEHSTRIPLILAGPGCKPQLQSDALCCLPDLFPTLCDLLNIATPGSVEGLSLSPVLSHRQRTVRQHLFAG